MIRVYLYPKEEFPESLITHTEILRLEEPDSADVLLLFTPFYDRTAFFAIDEMLQRLSKPALIIYENAEDRSLKEAVFQNRIAGAIHSEASPQQIFIALQAILSGLKILNGFNPSDRIPADAVLLTPRELEILRLIADGEGNKSIAYLLDISEHTVKFHISSIFGKLQASSRTEAIKKGIQRGLISI